MEVRINSFLIGALTAMVAISLYVSVSTYDKVDKTLSFLNSRETVICER